MATYYVDPSDAGSDSGTQANPWHSIASAIAAVGAGDTVKLRNTETLSGTQTFATAGSEAAGRIKWIGCPVGSWTPDGTTFKLDCNDAVATGLSIDVAYQWLENIEIYDATGTGINIGSNGDYCVFINVLSYSHDANGFICDGSTCYFERCISHSNGTNGYDNISSTNLFHLCTAYGNADCGFINDSTATVFLRCIAHDNGGSAGDAGFELDLFSCCINCVVDGEVNGIEMNDASGFALACRITNNTNGIVIAAAGDLSIHGYNVFHASATADIDDSGVDTQQIQLDGADTNQIDQDADDGYENRAANDFNIKTSRTYNGDGNDTVGLGIGS